MKFPKIRFSAREKQGFSDFSCQDAEGKNSFIEGAVNTEYRGGAVRTRRSFVATGDVVCTATDASTQSFVFTGALWRTDSGVSELTYLLKRNDDNSRTINFFFFGADGNVESAGKIDYLPTNGINRRQPESLVCFSSVPKYGTGIYAFIKVYNLEINDYELDIYELASEDARWILISDSDFYVPTHLWGGRGDSWNLCETSLAEPEIREPLNMLGGVCDCYFTTDGVSFNYPFPEMGYDIETDGYITADVRLDRETLLTFKINKHSIVSNAQTYGGKSIEMVFTGDSIYFISGTEHYIMPRYYSKSNNMRVRVVHSTAEEKRWFTDVHTAVTHSFGTGGDRLILANGVSSLAGIAVSAENNPFYFPKDNFIPLGDGAKITAACQNGKELLIFKSTEIYKLAVSGGRLKTERLTGEIGAVNLRTVKSVGAVCCFIGNDNKPYAVYGDKVYPLACALGEYAELFNNEKAFACTSFNKYMVFAGKNALILELSGGAEALKKPRWNVWSFPFNSSFVGSISYGDDCTVIGVSNAAGVTYYYVARLENESGDLCYPYASVRFERMLYPIKTSIKTAPFRLKNGEFFSLDALELSATGRGDIGVSIYDQSGDIKRRSDININNGRKGCPIRLLPFMRARECCVELESEGQIELREIAFGYHKLYE